ncbi:MAG: ATP-binding protein, partial [Anaerolineales bacterium]
MSATLRISAELKNLDAIRDFVAESATALHASAKTVDDLILAVDEASTNIIRHGYRHQPGEIEIEMRRADDTLVIYLRDQAPPFDQTRLPNPNVTLPLEQ